ncbi:MAG: AAA family ATPase, partial [Deltaproteobacteria bacterium]|nr:AAA family ATPase [Nannocystaceae bacterium]
MKLIRLEVECFKCVERAELELGPGLNVLYGPNDLGKTSLGDAVRAVLLLQSTSSERKELEPWNGSGAPRVRLAFEHRERFYRVEKRFGEGTRAHALLEDSRDGQVWSKLEAQRAVDGELRKMLGWGVREPGGKGATKGLPSSFITTALLGRASQLEAVFGADLAKDTDPSGRESLAEALQTLAEDPLFKRMLVFAQQRLDAVKRADGSFSTKRESPLTKIGDRIKQLQQDYEQMVLAVQESEGIEAALRGHLERRAAHSEALEQARARLLEIEAMDAVASRVHEARERVARADARVEEIDALVAKHGAVQETADTLRAEIAAAERSAAG